MIQAVRHKAIDFSKARVLDRRWWKWVHAVLNDLERENMGKVYALQHNQHLAILQIPNLGDFAYNSNTTGAQNALGKFAESLFPWEGDLSAQALKSRSMAAMQETWKRLWGDPNDPEVQKRIQKAADEMMAKYQETLAKVQKKRSAVEARTKAITERLKKKKR